MKLHENTKLFREAVIATAQQKRIPEIYVEKDYWITLVLHSIFTSPIGKEVVFKGGTALSKCGQLIDRFSEDVDLVILRKSSDTGNQLKKKLKKISTHITKVVPEVNVDGVTKKLGMIRKTAHSYKNEFEGNFHQVHDFIIMESTWLGSFEPYTTGSVSSYIYEMMRKANQDGIIARYNMVPFPVLVLGIERTFCEKIMSLVRFSNSSSPITDLKKKVRHLYDIHMLLKNPQLDIFFKSNAFNTMLLRVAKDDKLSFKTNNEWLSKHPASALIFSNTEYIWGQLKNTYNSDFKELVYGDFPDENLILESIELVSKRLKRIRWFSE